MSRVAAAKQVVPMSENSEPEDVPAPIKVQYTATLRYEPWEVDEYDITEQGALQVLESHVQNKSVPVGEFEAHRERPGAAEMTALGVLEAARDDDTYVLEDEQQTLREAHAILQRRADRMNEDPAADL